MRIRIEELVGANMRREREDAGLSQAQLGELLAAYLGDPWLRRQAVSSAEKGRRAFTAAEILTIAYVLRSPVGQLFLPVPVQGSNVEDVRFIEVGAPDSKPIDLFQEQKEGAEDGDILVRSLVRGVMKTQIDLSRQLQEARRAVNAGLIALSLLQGETIGGGIADDDSDGGDQR